MKLEMNLFLNVILFGTVTFAGFTHGNASSEDHTNVSILQSHSGISESHGTATVSARGKIEHVPTEAPPHLQTPTTTTATTTIRTRLPFEKETNDLIQASNVSIEIAQLNLARYETQLNINALDTLLPKLRQIRQNMTDLLASPAPDHYAFETQSIDLDEKLTEVELQISKNRILLQRYEDMQRDTQKQLGEIYGSLGLLLLSQVVILSNKPVSIIPLAFSIKTERETSGFLKFAFSNYVEFGFGGSDIQTYLESLEDPRNRIFAYNMTIQLIKLHGARNDTLFVKVAKNIFNFTELAPLKSLLPERVKKIFTDEPKVIEMRFSSRRLLIRSDGRISLGISERTPAPVWKFYALKNSEYFAIVDVVQNKALGFVQSGSDTLHYLASSMSYTNEDSLKGNYFYHWKIVAYHTDDTLISRLINGCYIKFINRQTGLALDTLTGSDVVGQQPMDTSSQDWEIN